MLKGEGKLSVSQETMVAAAQMWLDAKLSEKVKVVEVLSDADNYGTSARFLFRLEEIPPNPLQGINPLQALTA